MTGIEIVDWIIGSVVALAGALGVLAGGMKMMAEGRALRQSPKTPYDMLGKRVETLEEANASLHETVFRVQSQVYRLAGVLTREVSTLIRWHDEGQAPPPPDREIAIIKQVIDEIQEDRKMTHKL